MTLDKILFVTGLVFDIVGAYFLARGIARKPLRSMADESEVGWGGPPNLYYVAGVLEQKADAQIGVVLLVVGFAIQSLDYLIFDMPPSWGVSRWFAGLACFALIPILYWAGVLVRRHLSRRYGSELLAYVLKSVPERGPRSMGYVCKAAKLLTPWLARQPDEDDAAFAERVWAMIDAAPKASV